MQNKKQRNIMKKWLVICGLLILVMGMVAGCLGSKTPPISRPPAPAVLVDYFRTGGFAGFNDRLVIFDNGIAVVSSRNINHEIMLNQTEITHIAEIFNTSEFSILEGNYSARPGSSDLIKYSVRYQNKTVNAEDTALPSALQPVIDELNRVLTLGVGVEPTSSLASNLPR
jgi:hypothetical protein